MNEKNQLFSDSVQKENKPILKRFGVVVLVIIIIVIGFFIFKGKPRAEKKKSAKLREVQKLVSKINTLDSNIQEKQTEVLNLINEYKNKTGRDISSVNMLNLSEVEKRILEKKIGEEKDISIKSLLNDIVSKNKEITGLKGKVKEIEALLPQPHFVIRGDNHYRIALNYLIDEKGVENESAKELIERAALFEHLCPGYKVWNFYAKNEFGTFVTQGTATVSPNTIRRKAKKKLEDAKNKAISERDVLAIEIKELEAKKSEIISQLELLNQEKHELIQKMSGLNEKNLKMQKNLNSLFYLLDSKTKLKQKGIIKSGFLSSPRLSKFSPEYFNLSIDLRSESIINISATEFNVKKINNIIIYPKFYKKGIDYSVVIDKTKQHASLTIIDKNKLKNERVVISIE